MQSDYRVKKLVTEEGGDVVAICYDVLYGETFEKYIGIPDDFDARENASNLLQDSNYEISDDIRAEIEETFGIAEFNDDQDYDGYQFYDFGDDEWEDDEDELEDEEEFAVPTRLFKRESFNLRETLNTIDLNTYNKYDLLNLYEACNLSENEKRALANIVYDQEDPSVIYDTLNDRFLGKEIEMPERVKDGVIHEDVISFKDTVDWLYDHETATEDALMYFEVDNLEDIDEKDLVGWIQDHKQLWDDYQYHFNKRNESKSIKEDKITDWDSTDSLGDDMDDKRVGYTVVVFEKKGEHGKTVGTYDNEKEAKEVVDSEYTNADSVVIRKEEARGRFSSPFLKRDNGKWQRYSNKEWVNESTDEFEFDDEFNAFYDGYTSELTDNEKKLLMIAQDMGNWGDLILDDEKNHKEYDRVEAKAKKICKEKGITFSELLDTIEDEGFNEDLETSTEWKHTDGPIKISPNSKMREIEIEDKSEVGDPSHPIQVGLRGRVNKLK